MRTAITALLVHLVDNVEALSKNKWSGVHFVKNGDIFFVDVYRVHASSFIPHTLSCGYYQNGEDFNKVIADIVKGGNFSKHVDWDAPSMWITIQA
jgi:hypothetical protein